MSQDSFLSRWSRRKLTSGKAEAAEPENTEALSEAEAPPEAGPGIESPDEEVLDEAELARLPPLAEITVTTDLAPFLRKGVPLALKNAAMRKMWMLDPAIRDHKDFAVDYAWDWNTPGGVPGNAGTISGESLKRMLDSLNPEPKEPAMAQSDSAAETEEPEAKAAQSEKSTADSGPKVRAADRGDADEADTTLDDDRMARPRRHGGAIPI
jgi:hypothetical protein